MTTATLDRTRTIAERLAGITDPSRRWETTRRSMALYLATVGEVDKELAPGWRRQLAELSQATTDVDYRERMESVREIAVEEWDGRSGSNCTEGTNRFLSTFGLPELDCTEREYGNCDDSDCTICNPETTKTVTVTLTVTLTITGEHDEEWTENDVREYLRVDTRNVDDVSDSEVSIDDVMVEVDR